MSGVRRGFPLAFAGMRVGLLGGTFDPAHEGHRHIAETAERRLGLDKVWWMATPQNPLKPKAAPLSARLASARAMARGAKHEVTDFEARLGLSYTIDTIGALNALYPGVHFVLLLGGDNLSSFHRWRRWREIQKLLPIAIVSRPGADAQARLNGAFAGIPLAQDPAALFTQAPPVWAYLPARFSFLSSSALRAKGKVTGSRSG